VIALSTGPFVVVFFVVCEVCAPLGMGGLGSQPFEVSETFSTPGSLKPLLTQGTILLNSGGIQWELVDFCIDFLVFFVVLSVSEEVGHNSPIVHFPCTLNHLQELGVWASENAPEPSWNMSSWHII
jgi:hypothetical protein